MKAKLICLLIAFWFMAHTLGAQAIFEHGPTPGSMGRRLSGMALAFTENHGQWGELTLFRAEAGGVTLFFCRDHVAYLFRRDTGKLIEYGSLSYREIPRIDDRLYRPRYEQEAMLVRVQFVAANPGLEIVGEDRLPYNCNYFYGNDPEKWRTDVPNWPAIVYNDLWPGIDLRYHGNGKRMKYDFIVNPGAEISQIAIRYDGIEDISVSSGGDLQVHTRFGLISERIPSAYQETAGSRHNVASRYRIVEPGVFGFEVEGYNPSIVLVIDPELVFSTYLGGNGPENGTGIVIDESGYVYVSGQTGSEGFPTENPYDSTYNGGLWGGDFFVTKFDPSGGQIIFSTYIGGSSDEYEPAIAVDSYGSAYIAGHTISPDYPVVNAFDSSYNSNWDGAVTKLSPQGNDLIYSTYLGGSDADIAYGIALDGSGAAYVTGHTWSIDLPTENAFDDTYNGGILGDAFLTKFAPSGDVLDYSTYFGGSDNEYGIDVKAYPSGAAVIVGSTSSTDLPMVDSFDYTFNGGSDTFISIFSPDGDSLEYSTYIGGSSADYCSALELGPRGTVYIAGDCWSPDFPVENPYQGELSGVRDAYITKLSTLDNELIFSTYLGGTYWDFAYDIDVDDKDEVYVTGWTKSEDFPLAEPFDSVNTNATEEGFISILNSFGNELLFSSYLGGSGADWGTRISTNPHGEFACTGYTSSPDFPVYNAFDSTYDGYFWDSFVTKFDESTYIDHQEQIPTITSLFSGYPNPFNNTAIFEFQTTQRMEIDVSIFNLLGQRVANLFQGVEEAGAHRIVWDASELPSGIYFARLETAAACKTVKMVLLK